MSAPDAGKSVGNFRNRLCPWHPLGQWRPKSARGGGPMPPRVIYPQRHLFARLAAPRGVCGHFRVFRSVFPDAPNGVLEFSDEEVQFQGGLGFHGVQIRHDDVRERLSEVVQLVRLLVSVGCLVQ